MTRIKFILDSEKIEYNKKVLADVIMRFFPDWRKVINELQKYAAQGGGVINEGILVKLSEENYDELFKALKAKNFTDMRSWIGKNLGDEFTSLARKFYDEAYMRIKKEDIPQMILILGEYQFKHAMAADKEINIAAMLTEMMLSIDFQ